MTINIYYGGRGLIDDPTLVVIKKMTDVLKELNVNVRKYNLYEVKNQIATLPQTFKQADGIVLASTVEWFSIGGYMLQFLDSCWLYGDKGIIERLYMCPVVMSTTSGEREGMHSLESAWEVLGGRLCQGLCGYITDASKLELDKGLLGIVEKRTEGIYRTINQHQESFPASNRIVKQVVSTPKTIELTPQESEQLSHYTSDDSFVERQKNDLEELSGIYKDMMSDPEKDVRDIASQFEAVFRATPDAKGRYQIIVGDEEIPLSIRVSDGRLISCDIKGEIMPDMEIRISVDKLRAIVSGETTFQRCFMSGDMTMKGDFKMLRALDNMFIF